MNSISAINGSLASNQAPDLQASQLEQVQQTQSQFEQLKQQLKAGEAVSESSTQTASNSIDKAATDFESVFISLILKSMRSTLDESQGGLFAGDNSDTFGGMFDMFMSKHLSETSPIGVGSAIKNYLENQLSTASDQHESDSETTVDNVPAGDPPIVVSP